MNKPWRFLCLMCAAAIALSACGQPSSDASKPAATSAPTSVPVAQPTPGPNGAIDADGQLVPARSVDLKFGISGEVADVLVKEGDPVKAGDLIARLRDDALKVAVTRAEAGVASAQAQLANLPQQIVDAERNLKAAQSDYADARAGTIQVSQVLDAEAALEAAKYQQAQAQTAYDTILANGPLGAREEEARQALEQAKKNVEVAQAALDQLQAGSLTDMADDAKIVSAWAAVKAAQSELDFLKKLASDEVEGSPQASLKQAQADLELAGVNLTQTELRAPFDGTIASLDLQPGQQAQDGQPIGVLADFATWHVTTSGVSEYDVVGIQAGQEVAVTIDALPGVTLTGKVESIDLTFVVTNNAVTYPIRIVLVETDPRLRWGMTALVAFGQ